MLRKKNCMILQKNANGINIIQLHKKFVPLHFPAEIVKFMLE